MTGHLTIIVGTGGGAFANKKFLNNFFKCLGYAWGFCPGGGGGGGMLMAGSDLYVTTVWTWWNL